MQNRAFSLHHYYIFVVEINQYYRIQTQWIGFSSIQTMEYATQYAQS